MQEPRIVHLNLNTSGHGLPNKAAEFAVARCPDPHPPPVYSRLDDYGPVNPIAPIGAPVGDKHKACPSSVPIAVISADGTTDML
eukprot:3019683-Amphidinium_carterae.2